MTVTSVSRSLLNRARALPRMGQLFPAKLYIAFPRQFCRFFPAITASDALSRPLKHPVAALRGSLSGPSQLLVTLQCP
jgi:hypothetical protein